MGVTYMCPWCDDEFEDVVKTNEHKRECDERPLKQLERNP